MQFEFTKEQHAFIRRAIETGRIGQEADAVREALALWEERERARVAILAAVDDADAAIATHGAREITDESMKELADAVKQRGRLRLQTESKSS